MELAGMGSVRTKGLENKGTRWLTWRPEELKCRGATNKREEGDVIRTEQAGLGLQEQVEEARPLRWKKGPFLLSWNKQNEGRKGALPRAEQLS